MTEPEGVLKEEHKKRLTKLRKDIAKYDEHVNKCDITGTNVLAESIGADIDFLKYSHIKNTEEEKQEITQLENIFSRHMDHLTRCACVKKIEK